jgi:hypothetical protein
LPATEAAERLKNAWNGFVQAVAQVEYTLPIGRMFDAVFALRAAVEAAIKSLGAVSAVEKLQENETVVESESNAAGNQDAEQFAQASEVAGSDQAVIAKGQPNETIVEAFDSGNNELAASSSQEKDSIIDDNIARILQEAIAPVINRIEELTQRVEAVESAVKTRRRVSSFVASSRKEENDEDLWRRWVKASESERRMLLREAQRLLAAPIPFDRD